LLTDHTQPGLGRTNPFWFQPVYSENTALPLKRGGTNHVEHEIKPGVDDFLSGSLSLQHR